MADVKKLVFSILKFLEDQKTAGSLSDDAVESLEGWYMDVVYLPSEHNPEFIKTVFRLCKDCLSFHGD